MPPRYSASSLFGIDTSGGLSHARNHSCWESGSRHSRTARAASLRSGLAVSFVKSRAWMSEVDASQVSMWSVTDAVSPVADVAIGGGMGRLMCAGATVALWQEAG